MRKMIYNVSGYKTTDYDEVKALNKPFTIEFEQVKETRTADQVKKDNERIEKRLAYFKNKRKRA